LNQTVLLIDDDQHLLAGLVRVLRKEPYRILTANSATEAAQLLERSAVDVIVSDQHMPGMNGTEFLARVGQAYPDVVRIVLTGNPSLPMALEAINEGKVFQLLTKPCNEIDLALTIRKALEHKALMEKAHNLAGETKQPSKLLDDARLIERLERLYGQDTAAAAGRKVEAPEPG
jgi:DNA-binding NtrC family response regulator